MKTLLGHILLGKKLVITAQDLIDIESLGKEVYLIEIQLDKSSKILRLISY